MDVVDLARRFIEIPSVTGEESAMAQACAEVLRPMGFEVQLLPVTADRFNLLATLQSPPRVLLNTHIDTVPPYFGLREEGDWLYGRGACDTKGILAAMIGAAAQLIAEGVDDFGLLLVVGEETDSIGAKHANSSLDLPDVRWTLVGEPTESKFARAQKGGFKFTIRVHGRAAHSGYPERGESAIMALLQLLHNIESFDWGQDPVLGAATANVGIVRGGLRANIVPEQAEAEIMVRVVDSAAAVRQRVEQWVSSCPLRVEWSEDTSNDPQHMTVIPDHPATVVAFNTDIPHLTNLGDCLLFGPGSILDAHSDHERISKKEMLAAVDVYAKAVGYLRRQSNMARGGAIAQGGAMPNGEREKL
jgi:acetylornithine deacetylase